MNNRFVAILCLVATCLFNTPKLASAATFVLQPADAYGPMSILIRGQIQAGDFEKFQTFLLRPGHLKAYTNYVWLDSTGGNLAEAMKFASLFEKSSASVVVGPDGKCYSACFIMFASGVDRWLYAFGELGVHQVSVDFAAGFPVPHKAARNDIVQALTNNASAYLAAQGIPQTLVSKMQETPASDMFIVNTLMIKREGWQRLMALQPQFLQAVEQVCGKQPEPAIPLWTACKVDLQTRRARQFVADELALLAAGQASSLFARGSLKDAQESARNVSP